MKEPYSNIYPSLNEENEYFQEFEEMNWETQLNSYQ